ncbi:dynactin 6, partial [Phenoliferia sp. Uapishka_3]
MSAPIILGSNCIIEEGVVIVNRTKQPLIIGDDNLFQVGCRVEAISIGSNNTFGARSRVAHTVRISSFCNIGAGCSVLPSPFPSAFFETPSSIPPPPSESELESSDAMEVSPSPTSLKTPAPSTGEQETLPDYTVVYGGENKRRIWTGEGQGQMKALHAKHLHYLSETLPKFHKLKLFT